MTVLRTSLAILLTLLAALPAGPELHAQEAAAPPGVRALAPDSIFHGTVGKAATGPGGQKQVSIIVRLQDAAAIDPFIAAAQQAIPSARVIYRYTRAFIGVSLLVPDAEVFRLSRLPGVSGVFGDILRQATTEVSPGFIGAPTLWNQLGGQGSAGEGVIVGVIDSGIWPEHPSYSDPDPLGKPFPAPPGGPYACQFGNTAWNAADAAFSCNNKLIGAKAFLATYKAVIGLRPTEFDSARDDNGHGTHTSSTAAGNRGVAASLLGVSRGTLSGIAPRAHVIMYRACADSGCFGSDLVAAVDQAVADGVDVINFSISGGGSPYVDPVSLAFLGAYDAGVFVAASAGNSGPGPDTVAHREPWTTTVAASGHNRTFQSTLALKADNGDTQTLTGASITAGIGTPTSLVFPPAGQELCLFPFAPGTFSGEIVICRRGVIARVAKSLNVAAGGAGGLVLYNPPGFQGLATDNHFIPSVHLDRDEGAALLGFMGSHSGVTATFTPGVAASTPGDVMAAFSSRGGPGQTLGISKPDVTAPGVQVLAGHTPLPATVEGGLPGELFQAIQGTSMSSPHVAGSAALIKQLNPGWTPGQIKSALMTTARTAGVTKEDGLTPADPFDLGSGRIDLGAAGAPGFTFDETAAGYTALQDGLWNANYPSLYLPGMPGVLTVPRILGSTAGKTRNWKTEVWAPPDLKVHVPKHVKLGPGASETIDIKVDARGVPEGEVRHATIEFKDGKERRTFPVTVIRKAPEGVSLIKSCDPLTLPHKGTTSCTITVTNNTPTDADVTVNDTLPKELQLDKGSVVGGAAVKNGVVFSGMLAGGTPLVITVAPGSSPFGYIPLSSVGVPPLGGVGDETIHNFTVPSFHYAGETWSSIGMVSNGYLVVGGGTGADVDFINQGLPDATPPNNVLAPFWTDLDPGAGGGLRVATATSGGSSWMVFDWEGVPNFFDGLLNSFQVWIGLNGFEDISFAYGSVSDGDGGFLTVGAENKLGQVGHNYYFDGSGTLPTAAVDLRVSTVPGTPGETHVISFSAKGQKKGPWQNCAELTSNLLAGITTDCVEGEVVK